MTDLMTRKQVWSIMWIVSTAAGMSVIVGMLTAALVHSGTIALAVFAVGITVIVGTGLALVPAWRRTTPR